ncbi:hypothetical protein VTK56DRAFT_596 [Thermocarpiscus australiensis]
MAEMEMETSDDILRKVALDGSMDYSSWPTLLPTVLARIEKIARTEFPIPKIPSRHPPARPPSPRFLAPLPSSDPVEAPDSSDTITASSSQDTNKENAIPSSPAVARSAGANANAGPASSAAPPSTPGAPHQPESPVSSALPKPIADMLDETISVLRSNFSEYPPHTIQRLAELVLRPRQHYRSLVAYLHALDRVVHVTSGANVYPLPPAIPDMSAMSLLANGAGGGAGNLSNPSAANNIGSDEALGGALLTPIPWLTGRANGGGSEDDSDAGSSSTLSADAESPQQFQVQPQQQHRQPGAGGHHFQGRVRTESTETIEGPNGMGSIETVSVSVNGIPSTGAGMALLTRGVTQGELLRQEQRAGVVPLNQQTGQQQQQQQQQDTHAAANGAADEDAAMGEDPEEDGEEVPHARGPEEIGPADTGPLPGSAASYIAAAGGGGGGGTVDVRTIDVEAAVGRTLQSPPAQQQQQDQRERGKRASGSPDENAAEIIPRSPKREATDELEPGHGRKRVKEDQPAGGASATSSVSTGQEQSQDQNQEDAAPQQPDRDGGSSSGDAASEKSEPRLDAEGDVALDDLPPDAASEEPPPSSSPPPPPPAQSGNSASAEPKSAEQLGSDGTDSIDVIGEKKPHKDGDELGTEVQDTSASDTS